MRKNLNHSGPAVMLRAMRHGLSALEFVGCVIAVVGGIWLGAIYLGVDVRHLAHTALSETELLESVPQQLRPPAPQESVTREQLVTTLREELGTLRGEITALREEPAALSSSSEAMSSPDSQAPSKAHSLAYWSRLNEIVLGEAALQADAEGAFDDAKAAKVFAIKSRIVRFAAKSVEAIPHEQVDPALVQFGRQVSNWYEHGSEHYERAVQIWESATNSAGREQLNRDWERAALHHRNEVQLLRDKGNAVRSAVSRRFGEEFPPFAATGQSTGN